MELTDLSLSQAAAQIQAGELSPLELCEAYLARIERLDPQINSYISLTAEEARRAARQAGAEIASGGYRGPLHGIPLGLKDLYETRGVRTSAGSRFFADYVPESEAAAVQKLRAAGALLLGKQNMHEIALGVTNVNPHYGACRNPWALERISGGSSGGSAAALAARLCLGALGSDTGGSIRIPAALCGVVGLKPTRGRVSLRGLIPLSWNLDHAGPMARDVESVALLLSAIAGYDSEDPYSVDAPPDDYLVHLREGVRGWRIALAQDKFFSRAEPEVLQAVQAAAGVFESLGAQVQPASPPGAYEAAQANGIMTASDGAAFHKERLEAQPELFGEDVRRRLLGGAATTSTEYILARRTQSLARHQFKVFFQEFDLLLTPATAVPAPPIHGPDAVEQARRLTRFTAPFNLTGLPAISLPCGFTSTGLPVGLQIVAAPWAEASLLRAAYAYEQTAGWIQRQPPL